MRLAVRLRVAVWLVTPAMALIVGGVIAPPALAGTVVAAYSCTSPSSFPTDSWDGAPGSPWDPADTGLWDPSNTNPNLSTDNGCPTGRLRMLAIGPTAQGASAQWATTLPPQMSLRSVSTAADAILVNPQAGSDGFGQRFFWAGGQDALSDTGPACCGNLDYGNGGNGLNLNAFPSGTRWFIMQVGCNASSGCAKPTNNSELLGVQSLRLTAWDTTNPAIAPDPGADLAGEAGRWIRGGPWDAGFSAVDNAGVCSVSAAINGTTVASSPAQQPVTGSWTECGQNAGHVDWGSGANTTGAGTAVVSGHVNSTSYPNAANSIALTFNASDAAGNSSSSTYDVNVDNQASTVSLAGPADAPSTAGTQYVSATATAGPSLVSAIYCSQDGGPYTQHPGASAQIPVSGLGSHQVSCYSQNNAIDPSGQLARSPIETFTMSIRQPTASAISFAKIADALRCHRTTVRVKVPVRLRTIQRHGRKLRLRPLTQVVRHRVWRCHARTVRRRVTVTVMRHGKPVKVTRVRRVALLPHVVQKATLRVGHGSGTTVSGYLELAGGTALSGRQVQVLAAPDNGLGQFTPMASVVTGANGTWTASVPPGPSRLIEAVYAGDGTTEPVTSALVSLIVPPRISMSISPRVLPWRGTVTIRGRLRGGYVPADGVALRLLVRYPGSRRGSLLLALRTDASGAFTIKWSFYSGRGVATLPLWIATTATESDYPFAASAGPRIAVTFGRRTPHRRHRATRHHKRHHRRR